MQVKKATIGAGRTGMFLAVVCVMICCGWTIGCGSGDSSMGTVTGTVTMDQAPLEGAVVTFTLKSGEGGRPSHGKTDEQGRYELLFTATQKGALLGEHTVTISTALSSLDEVTRRERVEPERVPPRYNTETELTAQVEKGSNTKDFDLESGGFKARPATADD